MASKQAKRYEEEQYYEYLTNQDFEEDFYEYIDNNVDYPNTENEDVK